MKRLVRSVKLLTGLGLAALVLTGCVGQQLEIAEMAKATGGPFDKALRAQYLKLAQVEYAEADYIDSDKFADRSIAAAAGQPPEPELIEARRINAEHVGAFKTAHRDLTGVLDVASVRLPKLAAMAQTSYDCWLQEQEEGHQPNDIAACKGDFDFAMGALKAALAPKPEKKAPPPPPKKVVKAYEKFVVYFAHDSAAMTGDAVKAVNKAVLSVDAAEPRRVVVSGHADRSGRAEYNVRLAARRAKAVAIMLDENSTTDLSGIIETKSYGETRNAIDTADGKREPKNRRVQIDVIR